MAKKVWVFDVKGERHIVELEHGFWSGKRDIIVDGVPLYSGSKVYDTGSVHQFDISGVPCVLRIKGRAISFGYELYVDGKSIT